MSIQILAYFSRCFAPVEKVEKRVVGIPIARNSQQGSRGRPVGKNPGSDVERLGEGDVETPDRCMAVAGESPRLHLMESDVDEQVLEEVATEIQACGQRALMDLARGVGKVILERF